MQKLLGKPIAQKIIAEVAKNTKKLTQKPELHIINCMPNLQTARYLQAKYIWAKKANIKTKIYQIKLPTEKKILDLINSLNLDSAVNGIVVQLPLPQDIDRKKIVWQINPLKDVDGFQMRLYRPPAPTAIIELLTYYDIPLAGKNVHLVGKGFLIGQPLSVLLKKIGARVTFSTRETPRAQIALDIASADIIICATGKKNTIEPEWVNEKQVLVDAGSSESNGQLGEISQSVARRVKALAPAVGGIGSVTIAKLLENTCESYFRQMIKR
ncbi:hypothetical protein CO101_01200 [Candidatus Berkelbacteria bacterium CG_4_9_14_3_um_filter_39_23]|uniref:Uncharacterized protein n=2 Tax=Candidatus Berkelbacteria TaxID=1618330 RepID=A0A2M7CIS2_9BACT|nr:bifunctional 5,10-methylenetetrahydrofolate dehydrogenase/5,10-methenyltetrahydrofolate cyclohydrolase [Candidatus Berkelbacteria bacterium]OIP05882.1 MAG: hypothetical protein AUK14_00765 [Candidatus Berkelbacteria bacterium CG2_30_39_44]PIV25528.1 MAG: hypothetical protein COS38_01160 [Candidatus Berkelbacteria bacterium CG03_land_8_20_14_0_80_40_36]PIX30674.1 MAG: hypothetical protein COZ62_01340 [Candidatus Berkelbacteria bacterium CG_4_8_14_3_um_filter_39_27]PIZ28503.1 MAG: hypothetical